MSIDTALASLDHLPDLVIIEFIAVADSYRTKALRVRSNDFAKSWRLFCLAQLSKGAGILHRFVNRPNALPPAPLFKNGTIAKTPTQALVLEQELWQPLWQKAEDQWDAHHVLQNLRAQCLSGLSRTSVPDKYDMPRYTAEMLFDSARKYKKTSKGSDHWLASEISGLPLCPCCR